MLPEANALSRRVFHTPDPASQTYFQRRDNNQKCALGLLTEALEQAGTGKAKVVAGRCSPDIDPILSMSCAVLI